MKKKILSFILIMIIFAINVSLVGATNISNEETLAQEETVKNDKLSAKSSNVILLDLNTGSVLYEKKSKNKIFPAEITEIMTAVVVLENANLEKLYEASETALANISEGDSKMGIITGEKLSVRQLLHGMILASAADASNVLAEGVGGSTEEFVAMMNKKATEIGMKNTNFTNPTGAHDERHYSTTRDMAILARYAMSIPEFCEIVKTQSYTITPTEKSKSERKIINRNHFVSSLLRADYYYKYSTGIKTGYTAEAKSCIAASAKKGNTELLCLIFGAKTEENVAISFVDCKNMFDYVFSNYSSVKIVSEDKIVAQTKLVNSRRTKKVILKAGKSLEALKDNKVEKSEITYKDKVPSSVSAPIEEKQEIGIREYFLNGVSVGCIPLVADKNYTFDPVAYFINKIIAFIKSPWLFITIFVVVVLLILKERHRRKVKRIERRKAKLERNRRMMEDINNYKSN
ncbi:MAG: D-alanyl-D-alanine carboxypeptidase [Clostridia bacterium]|nr:D-alanyl-D-alanine carboxypeptidase [Clostridia bacterium]